MRTVQVILIVAFLFLASLPSGFAQQPPAKPETTAQEPTPVATPRHQKIGFVDMDIVLKESKAVQEQIRRVEVQLEGKRLEIDGKVQERNRLQEALDKQGSVLTAQERDKRQKRIQQLKTEIEDLQFEANRMLKKSEQGVIEPVLDAVMQTVEEVGKAGNYDLILRGELVLYGQDATDLTDRIIEALDAKVLTIPGISGDSSDNRTTSPSLAAPTPGPGPPANGIKTPELLPLVP